MSKKKQTIDREIAVELKGVSKVYTIRHEKPTFVEQVFKKTNREKFKALDDVNLTIHKGEKVGIIGYNGSGKTTILKIIAGITSPTRGNVEVNGKAISLIELTAGFHPDLTGKENIFLNGLLIGMSRKEIENKLYQIISFADIGKFIDSPLYTYSDGMKLRLGFSIAIHADPDILVLDEGISAGDADFQKKSGKKIEQMFRKDKTIIVVSHWLDYLKKHCNKFLLLKKGRIIEAGGDKVLSAYGS